MTLTQINQLNLSFPVSFHISADCRTVTENIAMERNKVGNLFIDRNGNAVSLYQLSKKGGNHCTSGPMEPPRNHHSTSVLRTTEAPRTTTTAAEKLYLLLTAL